MVNSAEEAERAVAACRDAPAGTRSFGPLTAMVRHGFQYLETANEQVACIPMIETVEAVERIDEILAVPGIDAVYVGPSGLPLTMGRPPFADPDHPRFPDRPARVPRASPKTGLPPACHPRPAPAPPPEA